MTENVPYLEKGINLHSYSRSRENPKQDNLEEIHDKMHHSQILKTNLKKKNLEAAKSEMTSYLKEKNN